MAYRGGRGRGRGFGKGDFRFAKQEPFELFPDVELPDKEKIKKEIMLLQYHIKFRRHFRNSPYYLEETSSDKEETMDIERYSDKAKRSQMLSRESLTSSGYLILEPGYFPLELVQGTKHRTRRKVRWNQQRDLEKLKFLEELEAKLKDEGPKVKKEEGEEGDEEENVEEEEEEDSDEGDYEQNEDFDDDEDDYNMDDDGDDEAIM